MNERSVIHLKRKIDHDKRRDETRKEKGDYGKVLRLLL